MRMEVIQVEEEIEFLPFLPFLSLSYTVYANV